LLCPHATINTSTLSLFCNCTCFADAIHNSYYSVIRCIESHSIICLFCFVTSRVILCERIGASKFYLIGFLSLPVTRWKKLFQVQKSDEVIKEIGSTYLLLMGCIFIQINILIRFGIVNILRTKGVCVFIAWVQL